MSLADGMLQELEQEAQTTRRLLERVPDDRLTWRPQSKSRTLGELALHVATVPGGVAEFVSQPSPVQAPQFDRSEPARAHRSSCRRLTRASPRPKRFSERWTMRR